MGEKAMIKLPEQFKSFFDRAKPQPIDEDLGRRLAEWAAGGKPADPPVDLAVLTAAYTDCEVQAEFDKLEEKRKALTIPEGEARDQLKAARNAAKTRLANPGAM
jgi:hypothetical protein